MSRLYDCIDCATVWMQKLIMYSWWWSDLATSCEHASYKCISKRRWFTGLEGKWLRVTDERAKATSLKTAPVYINIYLVCVWVSLSVCAVVKMPESVFCVFVCRHACVHTLNATIQSSKPLIQTTVEPKSINNTRIHSKNCVILVQRAWWKWEGEEQQGWIPAKRDIFSIEENIRPFSLLG